MDGASALLAGGGTIGSVDDGTDRADRGGGLAIGTRFSGGCFLDDTWPRFLSVISFLAGADAEAGALTLGFDVCRVFEPGSVSVSPWCGDPDSDVGAGVGAGVGVGVGAGVDSGPGFGSLLL